MRGCSDEVVLSCYQYRVVWFRSGKSRLVGTVQPWMAVGVSEDSDR